MSPRLTTVHQPLRRMGEEAARLVIRLADEPARRRRAWTSPRASSCATARRRRRPGRGGARTATASCRAVSRLREGPGCRGLDLDRDHGVQPAGVVDDARRAREPHRVRERHVGARAARAEHELAGLDHARARAGRERRQVGGHGEAHLRALSGSRATRANPISRCTGRTTDATGSCRYSCTTSMPDRSPALRSRRRTVRLAVHADLGVIAVERLPLEPRVAQPMAEREGGRRVDARHVGRPGERRREVARRLRPGGRRDAHGQPPAGVHPAAEHARDRRGALFAREERLDDPGRLRRGAAERVRPSGEQHEHGGRARREHGVHERLLRARQLERLHVAALAARAPAEQAGAVAEGEDRDVGGCRERRGIRDALGLAAVDAGAARGPDLGRGELGAQGLEQRRDADADSTPGCCTTTCDGNE